jgi:hypothetical protein
MMKIQHKGNAVFSSTNEVVGGVQIVLQDLQANTMALLIVLGDYERIYNSPIEWLSYQQYINGSIYCSPQFTFSFLTFLP